MGDIFSKERFEVSILHCQSLGSILADDQVLHGNVKTLWPESRTQMGGIFPLRTQSSQVIWMFFKSRSEGCVHTITLGFSRFLFQCNPKNVTGWNWTGKKWLFEFKLKLRVSNIDQTSLGSSRSATPAWDVLGHLPNNGMPVFVFLTTLWSQSANAKS